MEVKDVVPNVITGDYRFDVAESVVYVPDQVTFGIQAFDNAGHPSSGVVSESFPYVVPVKLHYHLLQTNVTKEVEAPTLGTIQSFKAEAEVGDSVIFDVNGIGHFDLYDETGSPVEMATVQDEEAGSVSYKALAPTRQLYGLLWGMSSGAEMVEILYTAFDPTGVANVEVDGFRIHSERGTLSVHTPCAGVVAIYAVNGTQMALSQTEQGAQAFALPAGVYIVRFNGATIAKTIVR